MNKTCLLTLAVLVLAFVALPAAAQCGPYNPEQPCYGDGGGGGTGDCHACSGDQANGYYCLSYSSDPSAGPIIGGVTSCFAHNPWPADCPQVNPGQCASLYQGPKWCETSGSCIGYGSSADDTERQIAAIEKFLFNTFRQSSDDLFDWTSVTEKSLNQLPVSERPVARLAAYRAKFKAMVGRELKPGYVPIAPDGPRGRQRPATVAMSVLP